MSTRGRSLKELVIKVSKIFEKSWKPCPEKHDRYDYVETPADIAVRVLDVVSRLGYLENKIVVDLGCGRGVLSYTALEMGAHEAIGVEIDVELAKESKKLVNNGLFHIIIGAVPFVPLRKSSKYIVIQNPPFGIRGKGKGTHADIIFILSALFLARTVITFLYYHEKTLDFLRRFLAKMFGNVKISVIGTYDVDIKQQSFRHMREKKPIRVCVIVVERNGA